jgi:hypothetical protein
MTDPRDWSRVRGGGGFAASGRQALPPPPDERGRPRCCAARRERLLQRAAALQDSLRDQIAGQASRLEILESSLRAESRAARRRVNGGGGGGNSSGALSAPEAPREFISRRGGRTSSPGDAEDEIAPLEAAGARLPRADALSLCETESASELRAALRASQEARADLEHRLMAVAFRSPTF